jgi:hypothetical protein
VEAFLVVVLAALLLGAGVWAVVATAQVLSVADRGAGDE